MLYLFLKLQMLSKHIITDHQTQNAQCSIKTNEEDSGCR